MKRLIQYIAQLFPRTRAKMVEKDGRRHLRIWDAWMNLDFNIRCFDLMGKWEGNARHVLRSGGNVAIERSEQG